MRHALSTHYFVNHRLTVAALERILHSGIDAVEIFCAKQHLDYTNKSQVAELGHWFRDEKLRLHSLHLPMHTDDRWGRSGPQSHLNICDLNKAKRIAAVDEIKRAIEVVEVVPCPYLIQHVGGVTEEFDERKLDTTFGSLEEISLFARQRGSEILLENIPNEMSSSERLCYLLAVTHLNLNFCFDTGHANLMEGVGEAFERMKPRIRSTHVHDNNGIEDKHLFPTLAEGGTIDWKKTMGLLRSAEQQYPLLLELKESPDFPEPLESIKEIFERLENM